MTDRYAIDSELQVFMKTLPVLLSNIKKSCEAMHDDFYMDLRLIFMELIGNAITHGNDDKPHKKVYITVDYTDEGIISRITDEGNGFNYNEALRFDDHDLYAESGRGLQLVRLLTDSLTFNEKGNEVIFYKKAY